MIRYWHQLIFKLRIKTIHKYISFCRSVKYKLMGMQIGENTSLSKIFVTWPHKVSLGNNCVLEHHIFFKYDGIWSGHKSIVIDDNVFIGNHCEFNINCGLRIGKFSNIASGCKFIDHDHGTNLGSLLIGQQPSIQKEIVLEEDVWLGANVIVLKGVTIGSGAVVAAGAVVNKPIPGYEIWAGIPAKKISDRKQNSVLC